MRDDENSADTAEAAAEGLPPDLWQPALIAIVLALTLAVLWAG